MAQRKSHGTRDNAKSSHGSQVAHRQVIIEVYVTKDNAERIKKAFADGLLDQYGVTDIDLSEFQELLPIKNHRANKVRRDRLPRRDPDSPLEPSR